MCHHAVVSGYSQHAQDCEYFLTVLATLQVKTYKLVDIRTLVYHPFPLGFASLLVRKPTRVFNYPNFMFIIYIIHGIVSFVLSTETHQFTVFLTMFHPKSRLNC